MQHCGDVWICHYEEGAKLKRKALVVAVDLRSNPYLWFHALGVTKTTTSWIQEAEMRKNLVILTKVRSCPRDGWRDASKIFFISRWITHKPSILSMLGENFKVQIWSTLYNSRLLVSHQVDLLPSQIIDHFKLLKMSCSVWWCWFNLVCIWP